MPTSHQQQFYPLQPGEPIPGDWYAGTLPTNIEVGNNVLIDSSFCFKHFFSTRPVGLWVGHHVTFWRTSISTEENGFISIGDYSYITNASLVCSQSITIGKRVFIAGGVTIADSDFHPVEPAARLADTVALSPLGNNKHRPTITAMPVVLEDDVWVGFNATILKGVTIGAGAVIEPGAVVITDVLPGSTVAGNPAKPVTVYNEEKFYTNSL